LFSSSKASIGEYGRPGSVLEFTLEKQPALAGKNPLETGTQDIRAGWEISKDIRDCFDKMNRMDRII
jgi:hypothetical protein